MDSWPERGSTPLHIAIKRIITFLLCSVMCCAGSAWGDLKKFTPKYVDFDGEFQVKSLYDWDKNESTTTSTRYDLTVQEFFNVKGYGYIYSPLFVSMKTSLGLGLQQEKVDNDNGDKYTSYGDATQFKQEFKILPAHPYNLELFFLRATPMTGGRAGDTGSVVIYEYGAKAVYDQRPVSTTLSYIFHESSGTTDSDYESLLYNINYFDKGLTASATYNYNDSSTYDGLDNTTRDLYSLTLGKELEKIRFMSRWNKDSQDEDNRLDGFNRKSNLEREDFFAELDVDLPKNFRAHTSYNSTDRTSKDVHVGRETESFSNSDVYSFTLSHQLYNSLRTSIGAGYNTTESAGGEQDQESYRLNVDYSKKIPWGSFLASFWNGLSYLDNTGAPVTLFQTYTIELTSVTDSFTIQYQTVDETTIEVSVVDHYNNDSLVLLSEGSDYQIDKVGDFFRITVFAPPPAGLVTPDVTYPKGYSYKVDYAFLPSEYELRTKNLGTSLQLPLFSNLITPHYSYVQARQKVMDGIYPGLPSDSKMHTFGIGFNRYPYKGDVSQSWLRSNTTDEDRLNAYINYTKEITPFTSGFLTFSYEDVETTQFETTASAPETDLSEQLYNVQAQIQTVLPQKNLNTSLTANYSLYKGLGETTTISLYSSLIWHIGKLDLDLSASYSNSDSTVGDNTTKRQFATIRMMLKRELF